jgi:D-3-phosphoglycerate dehydrogenase
MVFKVVNLDPDLHTPEEWRRHFGAQSEMMLENRKCASEAELCQVCRDADAVLVARPTLTRKVIEAMERCQLIMRVGTGYDNVDVAAAGGRGIPVTNVPEFCTEEVADHTMALLLACARKLVMLDQEVRRGVWNADHVMPAYRLAGKTMGLVGFGKISRAVADRAMAFGMQVVYVRSRYYPPDAGSTQLKAQPCSALKDLLLTSDVVSLHAPLNSKTEGMIGREELSLMKRNGILINTGRGKLVVEAELIKALREGWIAAAGLDVLEQEPPPKEHPLFTIPNVVLSPHSGAHSVESLDSLRKQAAEEVIRALKGEPLLNVVNAKYINPAVLNSRFLGTIHV